MKTIAVLLAGGQSRRMGQPKAGLSLASGEAIGQRTERLLSWVCDEVLIAGHGHGFEPRDGTRTVLDPPGTQGALHALARLPLPDDTDFVLVSACDQPGLDLGALRLLRAQATADMGAVFIDPSGTLQPLPCCLPISIWKALVQAVELGQRRLASFVSGQPVRKLAMTGSRWLPGVNTPEQWRAWCTEHDPPSVARVCIDSGQAAGREDEVAVEAPLQILLGPAPLAVLMRTPGHDEELVAGFVLNEGIVGSFADITSVTRCEDVSLEAARGHVIRVELAPGAEIDVSKLARNTYVGSSCGICGQASIERALAIRGQIEGPWMPRIDVVTALPDRLRRHQMAFARTGGLHGAALFDAAGHLWVVREDVGRHNAVDKVLGWLAQWRDLSPPLGLFVSGRVSFEIVQKALASEVAVVAGVSAPTSLAVDLASAANISLWGFVREGRANHYVKAATTAQG